MSCGCEINPCNRQLLSRTISLQNGVDVLGLSYNEPRAPYRFWIQEDGQNSVVKIQLTFGYDAAVEVVTLFVNPGGAIEYFGTQPCNVRVQAMVADTDIALGFEGDPCVITQRVYSSVSQTITNAAYTALGDFNGTCPAYTNTCSIIPDGNIDVRITDISVAPAVVIFDKLNLDEANAYLRGLQLGNRYQVSARSVNPTARLGTVWSNE